MKAKKILSLIILPAIIIFLCGANGENGSKQANVYRYKKNEKAQIALTFDDGPHPVYTERILTILEKYNVKATFFMIGENIENYRSVALAVKNAGHEIGNHTFTHKTNLNDISLKKEIIACSETIFEILGAKTHIMRPPEGLLKKAIKECCSLLDYSIILWNVDTRDWAHTSPEEIYKNVISNTDAGDIILMHDYISKNSPTPEALEKIIPALLAKGFEFVTVSELISDEESTFIETKEYSEECLTDEKIKH